PGFDPASFVLPPAAVEDVHGFAFANATGLAGPLAGQLGSLPAQLEAWRPSRLRTAARREYDVAANWKTICENYHECDHCSNIHPALCRVTPPDSGENVDPDGAWVGRYIELSRPAETMSCHRRSHGGPMDALRDDHRRRVRDRGA